VDEFSQVIFDEGDFGTLERSDRKEGKNAWPKIEKRFKGYANIFRVSATRSKIPRSKQPCVEYLYKVEYINLLSHV
jgi:hypothetical protein